MLQYYAKDRLTAKQLYRYDFFTKQINKFKKIDLKNNENNLYSKNSELNSNIWSIYNPDNQDLLANISGSQFIKPTDKKEEEDFKNNIKKSFVQLPKNAIPDNPEFEKNQTETSNNEDTHSYYLFDQPSDELFGIK